MPPPLAAHGGRADCIDRSLSRTVSSTRAGDVDRRQALRQRMKELRAQLGSEQSDKPPPPAPMPPGWSETRTPTGQLYYYNAFTNETSWVMPGGGAPPAGASAAGRAGLQEQLNLAQAEYNQASMASRARSAPTFQPAALVSLSTLAGILTAL